MDVQALLARMAEQRAHWVDLPGAATAAGTPGRRLQFHRPPEVDLPTLMGGVMIEHVIQYACGWSGFTEADLLGAAVGSSDALPFDRALWAAWVRDHTDAVPPVAKALAEAVTAHLDARGAIAKNSPPSST